MPPNKIFHGSISVKYQCGFRKWFIAQNCLLAMWGCGKEQLTPKKFLTDLSKAFYCLPHDLIIADC